MGHNRDLLKELHTSGADLRTYIGGIYDGYSAMHKAALGDGALSAKTKELIALGIAIGDHCDGCIASHARGAARRGATPEEVAEAIGVAIQMTGGPGTVYGPRAWEAYKEFASSPT
jgi:AhpD family alkylhydroperoxidase